MKIYKITVTGLVQGIGFRPFVAELAEEWNLAGQVKNLGGIVEILVSGEEQAMDSFIQRLRFVQGKKCAIEWKGIKKIESMAVAEAYNEHFPILPGCRVDRMEVEVIPVDHLEYRTDNFLIPRGRVAGDENFQLSSSGAAYVPEYVGKKEIPKFHIVESGETREKRRFLPVDMPTCNQCVAEMHDKGNRRYRYPFISCTACGPRFSIQKAVPYDRDTIAMDDFTMCDACYSEYTEKGNIRRHAQTIACSECGPRLRYVAIKECVQEQRADCEADGRDIQTCYGEYEAKRKEAFRTHQGKKICQQNVLQMIKTFEEDRMEITDEQQAMEAAIHALKNGRIGAIKDIGGYHFAFSPFHREAAVRLREFKNRDKKPFAVMFLNMESIKEYCEVSEKEEELLLSSARPIVLLKKKKDFVSEICGDSDRMGALLPCNPLQILLLEETGPLVMTSGNRGGEPIIINEKEMWEHIRPNGIDFMLTHDREILTPLDDSIYQVAEVPSHLQEHIDDSVFISEQTESSLRWNTVSSKTMMERMKDSISTNGQEKNVRLLPQLIRRARGLVPEPIALGRKLPQDTFAAGGDLKAVFALGREELVYMSQYFGDLEDVRCMEGRRAGIARLCELLEIHPKLQVSDLHPAYLSAQEEVCDQCAYDTQNFHSTEMELGKKTVVQKMIKVQHHHAHVASVIAEHGLEGKVLGITCDGTGFGTDGTIWGSEFLFCEEERMQRVGHLFPVKLIGGDTSAKQADMTLLSYMLDARERGLDTEMFFQEQSASEDAPKRRLQEMAWKQNINTVYSSSMGRLFDAAAAVLDICHVNSYEGECAILLEQAAHRNAQALCSCNMTEYTGGKLLEIPYLKKDGTWQFDGAALLLQLYQLKQEYEPSTLAYLFHHAVATGIVEIAEQICKEQGIEQIVLSGGSFINRILLREVMYGLQQCGKRVYINEKVPCGDGGIALGQMYLATFHQ